LICNMHGQDEKHNQNFSQKSWRSKRRVGDTVKMDLKERWCVCVCVCVCGLDSADWRHDPLLGFSERGKWTFGTQKVKGISSPADYSQGLNSRYVPWS